MTKKVLFVASVAIHLNAFHRPYLRRLNELGYEVHVVCNGDFKDVNVKKVWNVEFERSPFSIKHIKHLMQLKKIINENKYTLISCHTPMASVLTRLASISARNNGTRVLYTAHGFHFYKGGSVWSWLTYFPVEIALSYLTDGIVCINKEDFNLIKRKGSSNTKYYLIPGIGVNPERFKPISSEEGNDLRKKLGLKHNDFVISYAAEFIERKNHKLIIDALYQLDKSLDNIVVVFAGRGVLIEKIKDYTHNLKLTNKVHFLGFVSNVEEYYQVADLAISSSKQEGLGINLVEAMMCSTPVVATVDRGHCTIIEHGKEGLLFEQDSIEGLVNAITELYKDSEQRAKMASYALKKAELFSLKNSLEKMDRIYSDFL